MNAVVQSISLELTREEVFELISLLTPIMEGSADYKERDFAELLISLLNHQVRRH